MIIFGIFQNLLGLFFLGAAALVLFTLMIPTGAAAEAMSLKMILPGVLMYLILAAASFSLGIGSMQCRRWARALTLIFAWVSLFFGVILLPLMAWLMPQLMSSVATADEELSEGMMQLIIVIQLVFMGFIFIIIPAAFVLFYRSRHVKATCETRDPVSRWTDNCPLPVLAITVLASWSAFSMLALSLVGMAMFPFFGTLLTGLPGATLMVATAIFVFWIGRSCYQLKIAGWWALLVMTIVFGISNVLTFSRIDIFEIYEKLDYPEEQIELIRQQGWFTGDFMTWNIVAWVVPMLIYALWIKRFFREAAPATQSP